MNRLYQWMRRRPRWSAGIAGVAGMVLLAGCAASELRPGLALQPAADEAVVVLSVTHSGQRGYDLLLRLDGPGRAPSPWVRLAAFGQARDWEGVAGFLPTPRDNPDGRLLVLRLRPGEHRIDHWHGIARQDGYNGDGFQINGEPLAVRFTAEAGRVTYVGNVHLAIPERIDYLANLRYASYELAIEDMRPRDLERLRARHPGLNGSVQARLAASPRAGQPLRYYVHNFSAGGDRD